VFLKCSTRRKDGKEHRSWSVVESRRYGDGKVAQRHVLYLGEINDSQRLAWERAITVFDESTGMTEQMALFPVDRLPQRVALRRCTCAWISAAGTSAAMGRVLAGRRIVAHPSPR